ncbi:MAG: histidine kinase dimerization/phospho-acceptor domain-containing protein [bacterium]|nr:histidine kinase dimerization/phospho-acceptor domain-containing protein [bacterium]
MLERDRQEESPIVVSYLNPDIDSSLVGTPEVEVVTNIFKRINVLRRWATIRARKPWSPEELLKPQEEAAVGGNGSPAEEVEVAQQISLGMGKMSKRLAEDFHELRIIHKLLRKHDLLDPGDRLTSGKEVKALRTGLTDIGVTVSPEIIEQFDVESRITDELSKTFSADTQNAADRLRQLTVVTVKPEVRELAIHNFHELQRLCKNLAGIVHDINNPLAVIKGNLQAVQRHPVHLEKLQAELRRGFANLITKIDIRTQQIIEGIEFKKEVLTFAELKAICQKKVPSFLAAAEARVGKISSSFSEEQGITSDRTFIFSREILGDIVENCVQNSIKSLEAEGTIESIEGKRPQIFEVKVKIADDENYVDIDIEDSGTGIKEEIIGAGSFLNGVHGYASPKIDSTGIAMAHYAEIVADHYGGLIVPQYRKDKYGNIIPGARVTIRLPRKIKPKWSID